MTDFERYVLNEHVEDFNDGIISRRELLRRVTLITGSLAATVTILEVMGCGSTPSGTPAQPVSRASSTPQPFATPPASPTTDGITVQPTDPRIKEETLAVKGQDGASLISYAARPASGKPAGGILVVHENRGLLPHIKDVVRRVATAGFTGLSIDLLSRDGGADKLSDQAAYGAALAKRPVPDMVSDLMQALAALSDSGVGSKMGITGFCFGGGMVWNTLVGGAQVKAGVPFYGPKPADITNLAKTKAAVFAIYAEQDTAITATKDQMEAALTQAGVPHQIMVYPGVGHAFHNDTGARYNAVQAEAAWVATIEWFRKYVR
ncbi:MAG TPA: dienelactone hydrolase family protein [Candidatus Dormibacteraeota bacterium]|nr:dienelactone hydrolase family protein [Candidatus Dormibacteraeota bacterium]